MKSIAYVFFLAAALCALGGMTWGLIMSASHDHTMAPAHAHLNLVGWATMALFGIFYQLVPAAAVGLLPRIHAALAIPGVVLMVPGIALAVHGKGEILAVLGTLLTLASMALFVFVVATRGRATA